MSPINKLIHFEQSKKIVAFDAIVHSDQVSAFSLSVLAYIYILLSLSKDLEVFSLYYNYI